MVTISDVAAHAGVGAGTVSRVLNNSPHVRDETRARVLAAIELLDYRPNSFARALSRGRCQTVGVVVPFFTQPSAVERLRGVVAAIHGSPYDLVLFNVESPLHRDEQFASLVRRDRADGLLVISLPPPRDALDRLLAAGIPVVLIDAYEDGVPVVVTDDVEGGRMATRHLASLGHELIAFIGDDPSNPFGFTSSAQREKGYRDALTQAGIRPRRSLVKHGPHDRQVGRRLAEALLAQRTVPTAIFAASDVQALGALEAVRAGGRRVPQDVSVVGFDDIELSAYARVTTVRQPLFESGHLGAELLLAALGGDRDIDAGIHELPLELVTRETTGPPHRARARADEEGVLT